MSFSVSRRRRDGMLPVTDSNADWRSLFFFSFLKGRQDVQDQGSGGHKMNIQWLKYFIHYYFSKDSRGGVQVLEITVH
jgi:hypothetical protein